MRKGCSLPTSNVFCETLRCPSERSNSSRRFIAFAESVPCFALLPRRFEFVAGLPALQFRSLCRLLAEQKSKSRHLRESAEIHLWPVFIARLVIMMIHVVLRLRLAPRRVVAFVFQSFADGKRRNAHARQTEMIGTIVMAGLGARIRSNPY